MRSLLGLPMPVALATWGLVSRLLLGRSLEVGLWAFTNLPCHGGSFVLPTRLQMHALQVRRWTSALSVQVQRGLSQPFWSYHVLGLTLTAQSRVGPTFSPSMSVYSISKRSRPASVHSGGPTGHCGMSMHGHHASS